MRIGVIGHKGRLGSELVKKLPERGFEPIICDITNTDSIQTAISDKYYDCIINCSAYTDVDKAEEEIMTAYAINGGGPQNLAKVFPGYIVHLSSDYIFDGMDGPYTEDDIPSPISSYGFSKYWGEVGLRPYMDRTLIVRTTILYDNGIYPNFVTSVLKQLKANKFVNVPRDLFGNPTYIPHLAHALIYAINKKCTGIVNIAGRTRMSRYDTAKEIAIMFGYDERNVIPGPVWGAAKRPHKAGFLLEKAKQLNIPLYNLWQGLDALKTHMEQNAS